MLEMLKIPRLRIRLDCMLLKNNLQSSLVVVAKSAKIIAAGIREIRNSKHLRSILAMVLACGNFLNHESERRVR